MSEPDERTHANERASNASPERLTFEEVAERLNVSRDAVRMRVRRGSLATVEVNGRTLVLWPQPEAPERAHARTTERTRSERRATVQTDDRLVAALEGRIASLEGELQFLHGELNSRTEELRRKDHLLAAALERLPALAETVDAAVSEIQAPLRDERSY
jgi:excisionase family DNA binding protein